MNQTLKMVQLTFIDYWPVKNRQTNNSCLNNFPTFLFCHEIEVKIVLYNFGSRLRRL